MPAYKDAERKTWYVKYSQTTNGKRKQILKRGFATKHDAQDWEAEQRGKEKPDSISFGEMAEKYYAFNSPKDRTKEAQTSMLKKYFDYYNMPLNSVKKADMADWYIKFTAVDLKPSTKNLIISVIRSVFKYASDMYDMPNPALVMKRVKQPQRKYDTWTPEQFRQFISVVDLEYYKAIFSFIYYTGCRKSEALSLTRKDFTETAVHIHGTKTETSDRVLTTAPALRAILKPILDRCKNGDDLVFPISQTTLQDRFKAYTEASGLPPIRIHDLRHSFATNLIGSGANVVAVSKYLGHANVNQTLKTYTHLFKQADEDLINKINGIMTVSDS